MPTARSQVPATELAVFARNHRQHLEEAVHATERDPGALRVFRSRKRWTTAARIVRQHGPMSIYFGVVDEGPLVAYEGELIEVQEDPDPVSDDTKRLLAFAGDTTRHEELWNETVKTLYLVRACHRVDSPFLQSALLKFNGGQPLQDNYTRAYALVRRRTGAV